MPMEPLLDVDGNKIMMMREPLHIECLRNDSIALKKLIESGEHDISDTDCCGRSALHIAAKEGAETCARLLIAAGIDINLRTNEYGIKAMHCACGHSKGHLEIFRHLIEKGADVNEAEPLGWTPLMRACMSRNKELVQLLLDNGALTTPAVTQGMVISHTAADLARLCGPEGKELAEKLDKLDKENGVVRTAPPASTGPAPKDVQVIEKTWLKETLIWGLHVKKSFAAGIEAILRDLEPKGALGDCGLVAEVMLSGCCWVDPAAEVIEELAEFDSAVW
eukprot:CAMPEP_0174706394 /NCGR_PEP_ID=MMETSP1094-20130205/9259_1 /TAXON_ID=156173 /ORGANISM="Chrysochromulina brevifilum, Strain UTEX LB 985" /LENGTH=277 /DNA_ID=CAMNT_0015904651 /DNA_START=38 /DNA_END=868 /DNA_ORIENTATION=-